MDLTTWIADYHAYLKSHGYATRTIGFRLKYLSCFERFVKSQGLKSLEEFMPEDTADFVRYWVRHQAWAKTSQGFRRKYRFQPPHHIALQYSLHCFFRWAHSSGRLRRDVFPLQPPVRGDYFLPQIDGYLRFSREHKGLAENSLVQIELFVRRFDQFLHSHQLTDWRQIESHHIDLFVRQQAAHNIGRVQRIHKILRGLFRYLFSLGQLDRDWASALRSPPQYRLARTPRALSAQQVLHLLESINRQQPSGTRDFAILLMAASLGVRASEIAALRLEDLDWKRAVVRFPAVKGQRFLHLPLSRPLVKALTDYFQKERPAASPYRNVFLRRIPPWGPLEPGSVSLLIARRMRQAGIRGSGHGLRHAFASELLRAGTSFSTLQELLGHSHFTSTQVYTKIDLTQLREVTDNDAEDF